MRQMDEEKDGASTWGDLSICWKKNWQSALKGAAESAEVSRGRSTPSLGKPSTWLPWLIKLRYAEGKD
jgi:hypothetical protein